ncbi:MAG: pyridoxamine 5'-phosphate oxidase family protein [Deltaproteobacteria bacterium]|jgi:predicted pyridoxine 5'-phosphate oxidase superfamily flavin-nucleotide-binding protein|nr:pyridoxamine 5'-phosphate oxidase family protein [Deltaproteobacteria bacterium]
MAKISQEIRDFVAGKLAWVATANSSGLPNLAPKGTLEIVDDETIVFADLFSLKSRTNLTVNPHIAVAVVESSPPNGYQFKGQAEMIDYGPDYEALVKKLSEAAPGLPKPAYLVRMKVTEIYNLAPGPLAGRKIA